MKTNNLDLDQKVKNLHFLIRNDKSTGGKFFLYMKSGFKVKRRRKKSVKSRGKNFKKNLKFFSPDFTPFFRLLLTFKPLFIYKKNLPPVDLSFHIKK